MNDLQLQKLVEEISLSCFRKPFLHKAIFNNRLRTTGGRYLLGTHNIEISKRYYEHFGVEEMIGVIKHELCHYHLHLSNKGYQHRDQDFKDLLKRVGAPRFCKTIVTDENKMKSMHILQCVKCGFIYRRKRKIDVKKYRCGKCNGKITNMGKGVDLLR